MFEVKRNISCVETTTESCKSRESHVSTLQSVVYLVYGELAYFLGIDLPSWSLNVKESRMRRAAPNDVGATTVEGLIH
jgi:hypothetical protein